MNATEIGLVERGRGLQLPSGRVTVRDLVPYLQQGCSHEEILRWIPSLTHEEIEVIEAYYRDHKAELDAEDRHVQAHREEQIRLQRIRFPQPEDTAEERLARLRARLHDQRREGNGAGAPR